MFQVAYGFYTPVEDERNRIHYGTSKPGSEKLDSTFEQFRIAGRTIEARLRVPAQGSEDNTSRWLWHCVLDLLTLLYFHQRFPALRTTELIAGQVEEHALTNNREQVPEDLVQKYLRPDGLEEPDEVKRRFAQALEDLIEHRR